MDRSKGQILLLMVIAVLVIGILLISNLQQLTLLAKANANKSQSQQLFKLAEKNLAQLEGLILNQQPVCIDPNLGWGGALKKKHWCRLSHGQNQTDYVVEYLGLAACVRIGKQSASIWRVTSRAVDEAHHQQHIIQSIIANVDQSIPICANHFKQISAGRQSWRWIV